ncbi:MAG: oxidoreductase [Candidatus Parabeggiatoa sp. nov. 3]|nr:MAG: oxidoreductase [Gammaproteobacteria bacterium]
MHNDIIITSQSPWMALAIMIPLLAAVLSFIGGRRTGPLFTLAAMVGVLVSVSWIAVQVWTQGPQSEAVGGWAAPLGRELYADGLSVLMLLMTAIVGSFITGYALQYFAHCEASLTSLSFREPSDVSKEQAIEAVPSLPHAVLSSEHSIVPVQEEKQHIEREGIQKNHKLVHNSHLFWPLWLLLWSGLNALFLSSDLFNLYIILTLIILAAVSLISLKGRAIALQASMRYLLVALFATSIYLLGLALLYGAVGTLDIKSLALELEANPTTLIAIVLIVIGLLIKTALFPFHFWLPATYAAASAPVSALLSALVLKGTFYILLRLGFEVFPIEWFPTLGQLLGLLGAIAILWGSWQAWQQEHLNRLIAYSIIAQVGYFFLLFPLASNMIDAPPWGLMAWKGGILLALSHALAISAMFMASGNLLLRLGTDRLDHLRGLGQRYPITFLTLAIAGMSIIGLPPSGGFLGNWLLLNAAYESGQWWWAGIIVIGIFLAIAYIGKIFTPVFDKPIAQSVVFEKTPVLLPLSMTWLPLLLAFIALVLGLVATSPLTLLEIGSPFTEI